MAQPGHPDVRDRRRHAARLFRLEGASTRGRDGLIWNALPTHLNDFQTWLVDQRNAESPSIVIRAFNGFANFLDDLVTWFTNFLGWMTWVGVTVAGVLDLAPLRRRAGRDLGVRRFRLVRSQRALAREHADAGADARGGRALARRRDAARRLGRPLRPLRPWHHPRPRRDADHAGVRLPDADRDPLLGRPGRRGDHDDDLRDPAGDPDHRARDPRRGPRTPSRRPRRWARRRGRCSSRCGSRSRGGCCSSPSTRRSSSRSRWS